MAIVEEAKKRNNIVEDVENCIAEYENVRILKKVGFNVIKPTDSLEVQKKKKKQEKRMIIGLAAVGELAIKYLLKIIRMNDTTVMNGHPVCEENYDSFKKAIYFTTAGNNLRNWLAARGFDQTRINNLFAIGAAEKQQAHNFNFLANLLQEVSPDTYNNLIKYIEIRRKSRNAKAVIAGEDSVDQGLDRQFISFPLFVDNNNGLLSTPLQEIATLISERNSTITDCGDSFIRYRYCSNEEDSTAREATLDELFDLATDLVSFVSDVHSFNEDLSVDSAVLFSRHTLDDSKIDYVQEHLNQIKPGDLYDDPKPEHVTHHLNPSQINDLYNHPKLKNKAEYLYNVLFFSDGLSDTEVQEILDSNTVDPSDYLTIFVYGLSMDEIKYFRTFGVNDYEEMGYQLDKFNNSKCRKDRMLHDYTYKDYEEVRCKICSPGTIDNMCLIDILDVPAIVALRQHPDILQYFKDVVINDCRHSVVNTTDLFNILLGEQSLKDCKDAWYGCDDAQLHIRFGITKALSKDRLLAMYLNSNLGGINEWLDNLDSNINEFRNNPLLLRKLPLFLNSDDTKYILNVLISRGFKMEDIDKLDNTILSYPTILVDIIVAILDELNIPLIVDNNVNQVIYEIVRIITKDDVLKSECRVYDGHDKEFVKRFNELDSSAICNIYNRVLSKYGEDKPIKLLYQY